MKKKEIENQYKKKIELIYQYNKSYYDQSEPLVSDKYYDDFKKDIILLEKNIIF